MQVNSHCDTVEEVPVNVSVLYLKVQLNHGDLSGNTHIRDKVSNRAISQFSSAFVSSGTLSVTLFGAGR